MAKREEWGTRVGFILAAVGSAIGLGNIWRFPYMAYENGGGAFLIPYFFAMVTAGIPILILEFGVGHRYRGSAPLAISKAFNTSKWEWLGWWQVLVAFIISLYYVVVIGWALGYFFLAFNRLWGDNPADYFFENFLRVTSSPLELGGIRWHIFLAIAFIWFANWVALTGGVKRGIEVANKIFMPLLFFLLLVMLGRAVTLPEAAAGLEWLFRLDLTAITNYKVWTAAYGQIFFSLSVGFAIMITYSSYLPTKADINNNACITVFINCGFSLLAGIMVFGVLGYMAARQGTEISEVISSGAGLAFVTIPTAINMLPASHLFGTLFFLALVSAGLTSMISITEACCSALMDKYGWTRKFTTTAFTVVAFGLSLLFVTRGGLFILDIVDHFINNFGIVFAGLAEIILLAWFFRLESIREHVNLTSEFRIGTWWNFCLKVITPAVLGYMGVANLLGDISENYGDYPAAALILFGWSVVVGIIVVAYLLRKTRGTRGRIWLDWLES
jgi:NSS family neurotransmitter:Na+ symporter